MEKFLKDYLGIILILIGVICLVVYFFKPISNLLLAMGLVMEIVGIISFILINRFCK